MNTSHMTHNQFDVAIIGSGIAGSTLAAVLARQGLSVILFEAGSHPKFAIGESMILETSEMMRSLAENYDIPELAYFSSENYFEHIGTSHGIKRHFSYAHHSEGQRFNPLRILQAVIPKQPHGHELHLYRQDTDYFLMTVAIRYGAKVLQNTPVQSVEIDESGVTLQTCKGQQFTAEYVVDAGGFRSLLAEQFDLRHHNLQTHSRAIFTHMVGVPCFHEVTIPRESYQIPFQLSEGTLHHVFEGGWLWVIPFNNHAKSTNPLCSVGLMLDPRVHPAQPDISAEAEFFQFIERFPSIASQFQQAKAVRSWTRTGRIQYGAKQVVGDRFCLLGQAAGFVDPLFSKGLYTALTCTAILADRLLAAKTAGDYSATFFKPVERVTQAHLRANDRLVAYAYKSFTDHRLWSAFSVLWLTGAYLELVKLINVRALSTGRQAYHQQLQALKQVGGGFAEFDELAEGIYNSLDKLNEPDAVENTEAKTVLIAQQISQQLEQTSWMPHVFKAVLQGKNHLPRNKFHPRLFKLQQGFLGIGRYRTHFFANRSLPFFLSFYLRERTKYSQQLLRLKRTHRLWKGEDLHPVR
ncbi:MAG: NAD(P)/FAD-dependent oxidoreductase [Cyanobacteria bacterium J06634_5]